MRNREWKIPTSEKFNIRVFLFHTNKAASVSQGYLDSCNHQVPRIFTNLKHTRNTDIDNRNPPELTPRLHFFPIIRNHSLDPVIISRSFDITLTLIQHFIRRYKGARS